MIAHHNDWDTSSQRSEPSSSITSSSDPGIMALKVEMAKINKNLIKVLQNVYALRAYQGGNSYQPQGTFPSNTITNPKEDLKGITTRSGTAYQGPTILTTFTSLPKVVERETDVRKDMVPHTNNESTNDDQHLVVQIKTPIPNSKPVEIPIVALVSEPVVSPVSTLKPNLKPSIPYPSRLHDQKLRDKTNDKKEKFSKSLKI
nr:hypothetical protein [Tanacetum cinerariifolium]